MTIQEFEQELKLLNKDLSIRPNQAPKRVVEAFPDVEKLAVITYCGTELCTIPNYEIFDQKNSSYGVDIRQDGRFIAHRTRPEALQIVKEKLARLANDKEYADDFFGRGESSDAALMSKDPEPNMLVEEITVEAKPVEGGMIEGSK